MRRYRRFLRTRPRSSSAIFWKAPTLRLVVSGMLLRPRKSLPSDFTTSMDFQTSYNCGAVAHPPQDLSCRRCLEIPPHVDSLYQLRKALRPLTCAPLLSRPRASSAVISANAAASQSIVTPCYFRPVAHRDVRQGEDVVDDGASADRRSANDRAINSICRNKKGK